MLCFVIFIHDFTLHLKQNDVIQLTNQKNMYILWCNLIYSLDSASKIDPWPQPWNIYDKSDMHNIQIKNLPILHHLRDLPELLKDQHVLHSKTKFALIYSGSLKKMWINSLVEPKLTSFLREDDNMWAIYFKWLQCSSDRHVLMCRSDNLSYMMGERYSRWTVWIQTWDWRRQ